MNNSTRKDMIQVIQLIAEKDSERCVTFMDTEVKEYLDKLFLKIDSLAVTTETNSKQLENLTKETAGLRKGLSHVEQDLSSVKQEVSDIKQDISDVKQDVSDVKQDISDVKQEVTKTNLAIENEIRPNIKLLAEAHSLNAGTRKDVQEIKQKVDEMDINVKALMDVVPEHSLKIEELKKRG